MMNLSRLKVLSLLVSSVVFSLRAFAGPPEMATITHSVPELPAGIFEAEQVDTPPRARSQPRPVYPAEMKRYKIEGEVSLLVIVDTDGHVKDPVVLKATDGRFGKAASEAVVKWRFKPAVHHGTKVPCRVQIPIVFEMEG